MIKIELKDLCYIALSEMMKNGQNYIDLKKLNAYAKKVFADAEKENPEKTFLVDNNLSKVTSCELQQEGQTIKLVAKMPKEFYVEEYGVNQYLMPHYFNSENLKVLKDSKRVRETAQVK